MSYNTIAKSAADQALTGRITACAAQEDRLTEGALSTDLVWAVVTASDVEAAYASALAADNPDPGGDESVVSDGMILGNVQAWTPPAAP